jgi:plasmid stabilization system protein ParE
MQIKFSKSAENDLVDGFWFYEHQDPGVGEYFRSSVGADIESLKVFAGVHSVVFGYHRMVCKTFPYNIYYRMIGKNRVEIVAIVAHRENRKPGACDK